MLTRARLARQRLRTRWPEPGQNIFHDPVSNHDVMVDHYIPNNAFGGPSYLGINYLDSSSGWLVVVV